MSNIINLKHVRKVKARSKKAALADQNRQKYGQTKAEKRKIKAENDAASNHLDQHKTNSEPSDEKN